MTSMKKPEKVRFVDPEQLEHFIDIDIEAREIYMMLPDTTGDEMRRSKGVIEGLKLAKGRIIQLET